MLNTNQVIELLENCDSNEIMQVNNAYCANNCYDDIIYDNENEFLETYFSSVVEVVKAIYYGEYSYNHKFVEFHNGNLISHDYLNTDNLVETVSKIANDIAENPENYPFLDLSDIEEEENV